MYWMRLSPLGNSWIMEVDELNRGYGPTDLVHAPRIDRNFIIHGISKEYPRIDKIVIDKIPRMKNW